MSLRALGGSLRELDVSANNFIELNASSFEGLSMLHTLSLSRLQNLRVIHVRQTLYSEPPIPLIND